MDAEKQATYKLPGANSRGKFKLIENQENQDKNIVIDGVYPELLSISNYTHSPTLKHTLQMKKVCCF